MSLLRDFFSGDLCALVRELRALIGRRATTVQEKYNLLEERDRIIRKGRDKKTSVGVGTCEDMCPEKERYQREIRQQISVYESTVPFGAPSSFVMDPRKAVKDYSRSSADQEEPLPHELRPVAALDLTMRYLLVQVVGVAPPIGESQLVAWFDFLWNRTRAIRKVALRLKRTGVSECL